MRSTLSCLLALWALLTSAPTFVSAAVAQGCDEDVVLYSQADIDAFDCAHVRGSLQISGDDITDLTPLSSLSSVWHSLRIQGNPHLPTLDGLDNLTSVGSVNIIDNAVLMSLAALEGVESVSVLDITDNASLASLAGLENLTEISNSLRIRNNGLLTSLDGLVGLTSIGSGPGLSDLWIEENSSLESISGLTGAAIFNPWLKIRYNPALVSLEGLENLASTRPLSITGNPSLTSLEALENLTTVNNSLRIASNEALESLAGLENLTSVGGNLIISNNASLESINELGALATLGLGLYVSHNDVLANLGGLGGLSSVIDGDLAITGNDALTSLAGLGGVTAVDGELSIYSNASLTRLDGLGQITSVAEDIYIAGNETLVECACGLTGLVSGEPPAFTGVGGSVTIQSNDPGGQCNSPQEVLEAPCPVVASEPSAGAPDRFSLSAPYPNPLRRIATIGFAVPSAANVRLVVHDLLGREVAVLLDAPMEAGRHVVAFDTAGFPSGTYLVRMATEGGFDQAQRMTLVK